MQVLYDSVDLNATPYSIKENPHHSVADREIYLYDLSRERGGVAVVAEYKPKVMSFNGMIRGTSYADLDAKIDTFNELMSRQGKNFDIDHAGGTRRYRNCITRGHVYERKATDIIYAKFKLDIVAPDGVGITPSLTNQSVNGTTTATYNGSITITGSAKPRPAITITIQAKTGTLDTLSFQVGSQKITLSATMAATDVIVFDTGTKKVTLNGVEKDYEGIFPEFSVGSNSYTVTINGTTRTFDLDIDYYPSYL